MLTPINKDKFRIFLFNWVYVYNIPLSKVPKEAAEYAEKTFGIGAMELIEIVKGLYLSKYVEKAGKNPYDFQFTKEGFEYIKKLIDIYGDQDFEVKVH